MARSSNSDNNALRKEKEVEEASWTHDEEAGASRKGKGKAYPANRGKKNPTDIDLVHLEDVETEKAGFRKKTKRHFARYRLCYAGFLLVGLAAGLPILLLVIIPALAQLIVDKTDLPLYDTVLMAQSDTSVKIGMSTSLNIPAGLKVVMDPIEMWLYNKPSEGFNPFTMVSVDESTELEGDTSIVIEDKVVGIGNREELRKWLEMMLYQKTADISVRANTTAHLGALKFNIKLRKTITIDALDTLRGFRLDEARIILPPEEDGTNIRGEMTLPNWSQLHIGLGNLTFNVKAGDDLVVGHVSAFDVELPPGNTTLPFKGEVFLPVLFENFVDILGSQSQSISSGVIQLFVSGNSTTVDGEHITYLEDVLSEANILGQVPITQLITDALKSIRDGDLDLLGLGEVIIGGIGPLLDGLFGGNSGDNPFEDIFGGGNGTSPLQDILDRFGDSDDDEDNPFSDILGDLIGGFTDDNTTADALRDFGETMRTAAREERRGITEDFLLGLRRV